MAMIKGLFKGIWQMSNIFAYKEHELEIGYPTDVRHVAHIGWEGADTHPPSWMNEFKDARNFSPTSLSIPQSGESSWTSQDFELRGLQSPPAVSMGDSIPCREIPKIPRNKGKRVKNKASSSASSHSSTASSSSTRSSARSSARSSKSGTTFPSSLDAPEPIPNQIKVN